MLNPTNYVLAVAGSLVAGAGLLRGAERRRRWHRHPDDVRPAVAVRDRFVLGVRRGLVEPSVALSLSGKGQTTDGKHPAVSAVLTQPAGQANLKKVRVALPLSLALDPDNSNSGCAVLVRRGLQAGPEVPGVGRRRSGRRRCRRSSTQPLSGPVFFVKNERKDPEVGAVDQDDAEAGDPAGRVRTASSSR